LLRRLARLIRGLVMAPLGLVALVAPLVVAVSALWNALRSHRSGWYSLVHKIRDTLWGARKL